MVFSLRFPFPFSHTPRPSHIPTPTTAAAAAAAIGMGIGAGLAVSLKSAHAAVSPSPNPSPSPPFWASLSLADADPATSVEPKTGTAFPTVLDGTRRLLGTGVRRKSVFGLKNIDVYAFGVYADDSDVKRLSERQLNGNEEIVANVLDRDLRMTVRLQIVYGRLSIGSVRSAFEESVGSRIRKFSGSENKELLHRFTSSFKDEYKLPRGSVIDLSREQGYILLTRIDGKEVGRVESKLLCQSILDLYIGDDPFDRQAKENIQLNLASLLQK